jgi:hypothetical protein
MSLIPFFFFTISEGNFDENLLLRVTNAEQSKDLVSKDICYAS